MSCTLIYSAAAFAAVMLFLRSLRSRNWKKCFKMSMEGKTVVITGANSGLGQETAKELAKLKARVIMACRNELSAKEAVASIRKETTEGDLVIMKLDLGSLQSVREFSAEINRKEPRLDVLLLNAGIAAPMELGMKTHDGFEAHFGVNHLGHFLLANLLMEKLKSTYLKTKDSRVVVVSSSLYKKGELDFNNLMAEKGWKNVGHTSSGYCNSKLANMLFVRELCNKLEGTGVDVFALCPGWVYTGLSRYYNISWWKKILMLPVMAMFMKTPHQGAQTILHCTTANGLETGGLYVNCNLQEWTHGATDMDTAEKLWKVSEQLIERGSPS